MSLIKKRKSPGRPNRRLAKAIREICHTHASVDLLATMIQSGLDSFERANNCREEIKELIESVEGQDEETRSRIYKRISHQEVMAMGETKLAHEALTRVLPYVYPKKVESNVNIEGDVKHTADVSVEMIEDKINQLQSVS